MRYFAMIDGERRGPYELDELTKAGVRPDTYVWCKGMEDWEKAEDVADICRHFRQSIFDRLHPSATPAVQADTPAAPPGDDPYAGVPLGYRHMVRGSGEAPPQFSDDKPDLNRPPAPTLFISVFLMLFCFPVTGIVAIYYSFKARQCWTESMRSESKGSKQLYTEAERNALREAAHDNDRQARMWIGITFFLGMILYAFLGHKFT